MNGSVLSWIERAKGLTNSDEVTALVQELFEDRNLNLVAQYELAQGVAGEYVLAEEEIPAGLVGAIRELGRSPSGYTGLTVHMVAVHNLRSLRKAEL